MAEIGGKGLFSKEIHEALLDRRVDFAVHSLKDLETAAPRRDRPRLHAEARGCAGRIDTAAGRGLADPADPWGALPAGALVGTASVRRQAQLLAARPDLSRGHDPRQRADPAGAVASGEVAASLLALAGLRRLGLEARGGGGARPGGDGAGRGPGHRRRHRARRRRRTARAARRHRGPRGGRGLRRGTGAARGLDGSCRTPIGGHARLLAAAAPAPHRAGGAGGWFVPAEAFGGRRRWRTRRGSAPSWAASCGAIRRATSLPESLPTSSAVLVTRPEPGAAETARRVAALGWRPVLAPALVLAPRAAAAAEPPRPAQALLLTSRAAARAVPAARLPRAAGVRGGRGDGGRGSRARLRERHGRGGRCRRAGGTGGGPARPGGGAAAAGGGRGIRRGTGVRAAPARLSRAAPHRVSGGAGRRLPEAARAALAAEAVVAALFFSPRSARCAISLLRASGLAGALARADALAISPRVAAVLAAAAPEPRWRGLRVAARPDQDLLLQLLGPGPGTKDGGFRQAP